MTIDVGEPEPEIVSDRAFANVRPLTERWWVPLIRGGAAMAFGVLALLAPGISLITLVLLWGAYALVDGIFNLVAGVRKARAGRRWGWLVFEGVVSVIIGLLAFAWPDITVMALLLLIAAWAVLTGIAEIAAAIRLRRSIRGEWLLAASGLLSLALGVLLILFPGPGLLALLWMIAVYAFVFGLLLVGFGLRLHGWHRAGHFHRSVTSG